MEENHENLGNSSSECPVCGKFFSQKDIENHVNKCLFLNTKPEPANDPSPASKRNFGIFKKSPAPKRSKLEEKWQNGSKTKKLSVAEMERKIIDSSDDEAQCSKKPSEPDSSICPPKPIEDTIDMNIPLAEKMRPASIEEYVGQEHVLGKNTVLRTLFEKQTLPSMIFWGPPGCGKTTLAHIIANHSKDSQNVRFVKLSATMCGVNEVKDVVKVAKNEQKFKRKTILFMDEIHRFNKLQQDIFLPHVESGTITLIGATTENPSFSLNSALLSRCRVIVLEKLGTESMIKILKRALPEFHTVLMETNETPNIDGLDFEPKMIINAETLKWLAEICDGDARIGLNSLQLALKSVAAKENTGIKIISLDDIKEGVKKSHILYDRKGDQHYDIISALHKSIRASDDNAALYWCTRMIVGGEDPKYICRRLIRMASEDIGLADPNALTVATSTLSAVQHIGMPESDCIIAQCAVYLARAPKSREVHDAFKKCQFDIKNVKGILPSVPIHLRNAPTKLMKDLNYGVGYNLLHKDESGLEYMPEGLEDVRYFSE